MGKPVAKLDHVLHEVHGLNAEGDRCDYGSGFGERREDRSSGTKRGRRHRWPSRLEGGQARCTHAPRPAARLLG